MNQVFKVFKSITVFAAGILFIMFSACVTDPGDYMFEKDYLLTNVSSVELIFYDSSYEYVDSKDLVEPFYFNKVTTIKTLPKEKMDAFCASISECVFMICDDMLGYNSSACGTSILIRLCNENIIVMSDSYNYNSFVAEYDNAGKLLDKVLSFTDSKTFQKLVVAYFTE